MPGLQLLLMFYIAGAILGAKRFLRLFAGEFGPLIVFFTIVAVLLWPITLALLMWEMEIDQRAQGRRDPR